MQTTTSMDDAKRDDDKEVIESHCGVGSCRPQALQRFKNVLSFSIFFGLAAMITQSLGIYIVSQVTALEKQFNLSSATTGIILSCNDIGFLCAVLFISHFGSYGHIPRVISFSTFLFGVSGILASLCYFFDPYQLPKLSTESVRNSSLDPSFIAPLCDAGNTTSDGCGEEGVTSASSSPQWIVSFLGISMVLQGIGKSPRVSLSTAYIDDNNPIKTKSGFYIGISATMTLFGPALATALGGVFRTIPVDLQDTLLTARHPEWIGAWWLGFLLFGCLGVIVGIPLLFFPKQIVSPKETQSPKEDVPIKAKIKDLPKSMFRVLKSPVYSLSLIGILFLKFHVAGSQAFSSKYVEKQFMVPASKTNIILGVQSLISLSVGTFTGGLLTSRLKLTRAGCLKLILLTQLVAALATLAMVFLGCDTPQILGFHDKERSVEGRDKATAFGLFTFLSSLLGFLPAPIVYGYIIDSACLIWESSCGLRGACGQYDLDSLRIRLKATESALKVAAMIFFGVAFIVLKLQGGEKPTDESLELTGKTDKKMESSAK